MENHKLVVHIRVLYKGKEQEPSVPTVGLPYATDRAEGREHGTSEGSNPGHSVGTLNLSLSTDKDTRKSEQGEALLEKGTNDVEGVQKEYRKNYPLQTTKGKA